MDRFFCSDHHLLHENIIKYGKRPFNHVTEMGERLLEYHNAVVRPSDHVSFLGDLTMLRGGRQNREWLIKEIRKYHGHKRLYLGNHDHFPIQVYLDCGFEKIYATWRDEQGILFSHMPIHTQSLGFSVKANVHGHIHQNKSPDPVIWIDKKTQEVRFKPYVNVCLEATGYRPISYDELEARIKGEKEAWQNEIQPT